MKVKVLSEEFNKYGKIIEAKRFKELTKKELAESIVDPNNCIWEVNDIFIQDDNENIYYWDYVTKDEIEIVED